MTRKPLSPGQAKVFAFLVEFQAEEDRFPHTREIQRKFGWRSQTAAVSYLRQIALKGYIEQRHSLLHDKGWWRFSRDVEQIQISTNENLV